MVKLHEKLGRKFCVVGIVKEKTDRNGLETFQNRFFPFPLYEDKDKRFYSLLGSRTVFTNKNWNVFNTVKMLSQVRKRLRSKGRITGNFKGEGNIQGGVLLVTQQSGVVYQYSEKTGHEVPIGEIESEIAALGNSSTGV